MPDLDAVHQLHACGDVSDRDAEVRDRLALALGVERLDREGPRLEVERAGDAVAHVQRVGDSVAGIGPWLALGVVALAYFYSMYGFSMLTGHIVAMAAAFMAVAADAHAPAAVTALLLCYFSSLCGCLTPYSTGPMVIYSSLGYAPTRVWFGVGAVLSLFHVLVWMGLGPLWWKLLGWW